MYDLISPGRNYQELYDAIKSYGTWGKLTESCWAIVTASSAVEIRDYLHQFIDNNDRLMVIRGGREAAWRNMMAEKQWLEQNLAL